MELLENRFYDLDEIAEATGSNRQSSKLKRDVKRKLDAWGYEYEWHDRKGVTITARPLTPERQLKDLLVNRLNLNSQVDAVDFANFIIALSLIDGFGTAPWSVRADTMYNYTGKYVAESTLRGWASKLIATGNAIKEGKDALWHTYTEKGIKRREWVDRDDSRYREYCARRTDMLEALKASNLPPKQHWGEMVKSLYGEYGYYFYCPTLCLNALGNDVDEMYELVTQITELRR